MKPQAFSTRVLVAPSMFLLLATAAVHASAQYKVVTLANSYSNFGGSLASATYNLPQAGAALVLGLNPNPYFVASGAVDGSTDTSGTLTSSWDRSSLLVATSPPRQASAYAAADLGSGSLKSFAQSKSVLGSPYGSSGNGYAAFGDMLHWSVAGANDNTVTTIGVRFSLDGSWAKDQPAQSAGSMGWVLAFGSAGVHDQVAWLGTNPVTIQSQGFNGWSSSSFTRNLQTDSLTDLVFEGSYTLVGASGSFGVVSYLDAAVSGGTVDFSHTGQFGFTSLPATLTLSSDSGVFPITVAAVPEPETYALMLAGLGLMGWLVRRRRS